MVKIAQREAEADIRRSNLELSRQLASEPVRFRSDAYVLIDDAMYFFASISDQRFTGEYRLTSW